MKPAARQEQGLVAPSHTLCCVLASQASGASVLLVTRPRSSRTIIVCVVDLSYITLISLWVRLTVSDLVLILNMISLKLHTPLLPLAVTWRSGQQHEAASPSSKVEIATCCRGLKRDMQWYLCRRWESTTRGVE